MADPTTAFNTNSGDAQKLTDLLTGATIKLRLVTGATLSPTSAIGDITTNELTGNGYPAGGLTPTFSNAAHDAADGRAEAALARVTLTAAGADITWRQAVITVDNGTNYIWQIQQWTTDETLLDTNSRDFDVVLTMGNQGTVVNLVNT